MALAAREADGQVFADGVWCQAEGGALFLSLLPFPFPYPHLLSPYIPCIFIHFVLYIYFYFSLSPVPPVIALSLIYIFSQHFLFDLPLLIFLSVSFYPSFACSFLLIHIYALSSVFGQ